jgi:Fungal protein kinase
MRHWDIRQMPEALVAAAALFHSLPHHRHIARDDTHETADNGVRLLLTVPPLSASTTEQARWDCVQVVGQFYQRASVCYQRGLLQLCRSAHEVFLSQPTRLFLHGFYIRGSLIELCVFDRSGLHCSDVFDVQREFIQFLFIILSYQRMTDEDLGGNSVIETDEDAATLGSIL